MFEKGSSQAPATRLLSLDFFRGLTMFLLIGSGTGLYDLMMESGNPAVSWFDRQFEHPGFFLGCFSGLTQHLLHL